MSTNDPGQFPGEPPQPFGPPYGRPYGQPGAPYGAPPIPYASWGARLGAYLLDMIVSIAVLVVPLIVGFVVLAAGSTSTTDAFGETTTDVDTAAAVIAIALFVLSAVAGVWFQIWNFVFRQGRRTQSLGKQWVGIAVVSEATGRPIGAGAGFGRWLMHSYVDTLFGMCVPLGFLWPLWDARKRTWGDMAVGSVVVRAPKRS